MFYEDLKFDMQFKGRVIGVQLARLKEAEQFSISDFTTRMITTLRSTPPTDQDKWLLLYKCNEHHIPLRYTLQIFTILMMNRATINERLDYSIIYATTEEHVKTVRSLLNMYTPARPVKIAVGEDELELILNDENYTTRPAK